MVKKSCVVYKKVLMLSLVLVIMFKQKAETGLLIPAVYVSANDETDLIIPDAIIIYYFQLYKTLVMCYDKNLDNSMLDINVEYLYNLVYYIAINTKSVGIIKI